MDECKEFALKLSGRFRELNQSEMEKEHRISGKVRVAHLYVEIPSGWKNMPGEGIHRDGHGRTCIPLMRFSKTVGV